MANLESESQIKLARGTRRGTLTKLINGTNPILAARNKAAIKAHRIQLENHRSEIAQLDKQIETLKLKNDESLAENDIEEALRYQTKAYVALEEIDDVIEQLKPSAPEPRPVTTTTNVVQNSAKFKFPTINLPTFDGDIMKYKAFKEAFRVVDEETSFTDANRMTYLVGQLRGVAKHSVEGLSITDANYKTAIEILDKKYGDINKIKRAHIRALHELQAPNAKAKQIEEFVDEMNIHLRSLEAVDVNLNECNNCSFIHTVLMCSKLPVEFVDAIERVQGDKCTDLISLKRLIDKELERRKTLENDTPKTGHNLTTDRTEHKKAQTTRKNKTPSTTVGNYAVATSGCQLCNGSHNISQCTQFTTVAEKKDRIKQLGLCMKCLIHGHRVLDCKDWSKCQTCSDTWHHETLCYKKENAKKTATVANIRTRSNKENKTATALPTARMKIRTRNGLREVRALFDQGSQRSFIIKGISGEVDAYTTKMRIDGFNHEGEEKNYKVAKLAIALENQDDIKVEAVIVDNLPNRMVMPGIGEVADRLRANGRKLADDFAQNYDTVRIEMIVGADYYHSFVPSEKEGNVVVIPSKLGWMISGPLYTNATQSQTNVVTALRIGIQDGLDDVDTLWRLDTIGINQNEAHPDEKLALEHFNESITQENGKYIARLPWKAGHATLPENFGLAQGRLNSNLKKMRHDPVMLEQYDDVIQEQLKKGFIEKVDVSTTYAGENCHYLAHHAVKKESATTPIRIVFDCSAKISPEHVSLNDCLFSGPAMTPELPHILMRFRLKPNAAVADIAKAFLMIGLDERDRDATRFLWPDDINDPNSPVNIYRFKVILFGATCSQFVLNATIDHHLRKFTEQAEVAELIRRNIYVDNLLLTALTEEKITSLYKESKEMLGQAGLNLREWASNVSELNELAKNEDVADERQVIPVLGLKWDTCADTLSIAPRVLQDGTPTKRIILRGLASQYDPLGYLTPVTITGKFLMKDIWEGKYSWDEDLPEDISHTWEEIKVELNEMTRISIPRDTQLSGKIDLHVFVDASQKAYGAVVYGVQDGNAQLLMAKGRISPCKKLSIPKLELTAATIGARLAKYVRTAYEKDLDIENIHMWSDSKVVLGWLSAKAPLEAYMQNRKREIQHTIPEARWHYVNTHENPADLITRGCKAKRLNQSTLWWSGPKLIHDIIHDTEVITITTITEIITPVQPRNDSFLVDVAKRCSSYQKLVHLIALTQRFIANCRKKSTGNRNRQCLDLAETEKAEDWIMRTLQQECFADEIAYLQDNCRDKGPPLIRQLNLGLRDDKLVCVSRLENAEISDSAKYPTLLPSKHHVTELIIRKSHCDQLHVGVNSVIANLRQKYWIPHMRQRVKTVIKDCMKCKRERCLPYTKPKIPPLPACRVQECRPFAVTGIDYGGPLYVKELGKNGTVEKRYIALFTCATTRAVHLEVAKDLTAEAFIFALQRFVARRSFPKLLISDNGSNFLSGQRMLKSWEEHNAVREILNDNHCKWHFQPGRAPWFSGFIERMIGLTKRALNKGLGKAFVTDDELHTVMCKIESHLNNRPLTPASDSVDDLQPLTPSQLMLGYRLDSEPEPVIDPDERTDPSVMQKTIMTNRQDHVLRTLEHLRSRWHKEYLTALRQEIDNTKEGQTPSLNDIVLIHDEKPRVLWKLGKIMELHHGKDGLIRSVKLQTSNGVITRPVAKLYPLELHSTPSLHQNHSSDIPGLQHAARGQDTNQNPVLENEIGDNSVVPVDRPTRVLRTAAREARKKIRAQQQDELTL